MQSNQAQLASAAEAAMLPATPVAPAPTETPTPTAPAATPTTTATNHLKLSTIALTTLPATTHAPAKFTPHATPHITPQVSAPALSQAQAQQIHFNQLAAKFSPPPAMTGNAPMKVLSLKMGDVGISNLDRAMRVSFAMKSSNRDWADQSLEANDTREFGCGGMSEDPVTKAMQMSGDCLFWMQTGQKPAVYYRIQSKERYAIFWDDTQALWDLRVAR